jgi:hypothetical protein
MVAEDNAAQPFAPAFLGWGCGNHRPKPGSPFQAAMAGRTGGAAVS